MLGRIDRVVLTAVDADATADCWVRLLDAVVDRKDRLSALGATRTVVRVGDAELEILSPDGPGPVSDHLASSRGGPFAAGVTCADLPALRERFTRLGIEPLELGDQQLYLNEQALGIPGLSIVISAPEARSAVGFMSNLYETTHLTSEPMRTCTRFAEVFGLDQNEFVAIQSEAYGYDGFLTLFDPQALHRIETIHPADVEKTMGRYFQRFGASLYMCYGETADLPGLRERLQQSAPNDWTGADDNPDGLFVHPRALGGVMLGVSRTSYAWTWSGYPDRVVPVDQN